MARIRVEALRSESEGDFRSVMEATESSRCCSCTAHYFPDWEERGAERRAGMFETGESDGFLLFVDDRLVGWCQAAPRERLLWAGRIPEVPGARGIGCMVLRPEFRGRGLAGPVLRAVLERLHSGGAPVVAVMGHRPEAYDDPAAFLELPASTCEAAGLVLHRDDPVTPLYLSKGGT